MKLTTLFASTAVALAVPLASSWAADLPGPQPTGPQHTYQARGPGNPPSFDQLDRNGDGVVSREEFAAFSSLVEGRRRGAYDGPSWDTNPPVPPP
jgi:hypothetical protein